MYPEPTQVLFHRVCKRMVSILPVWTPLLNKGVIRSSGQGPERRARRDPTRWLQGLGPKVNWKTHSDNQAASLAKVPI